ncbi:MAG: CBS domain-containing protein [Gammaproteobacteria bacterium]
MKVHDAMVRDVQACSADSNLESVATVMWDGNIGAVPVVDEGGKPIGMVTDRDIAMAAALNHKPLWELTSQQVVRDRTVYTCHMQDDVKTAMKIMWAQKIRRLPVVDSAGKLQGILSIDDIIELAERGMRGQGTPELSYDDTMNTLKAVGKRH